MKPRLLIVSFSDIKNDARVRKQVNLFSKNYEVTTIGRGEAYQPDIGGGLPGSDGSGVRAENSDSTITHLSINYRESKLRDMLQAVLLRLKLFRLAFALEPETRAAKKVLKRQLRVAAHDERVRLEGRVQREQEWRGKGRRAKPFDLAIANDTESIAVAFKAAGDDRALADLHEYWPGIHDNIAAWNMIRKPYYVWQLNRFAKRAGARTTVSESIAERYLAEFEMQTGVVRNATPKHDLAVKPVDGAVGGSGGARAENGAANSATNSATAGKAEGAATGTTIKLVHSGVALPNRALELTMRAVAKVADAKAAVAEVAEAEAAESGQQNISLDLYLTGEKTAYAETLRSLADDLGDSVNVHPPKPYEQLVATLNSYDVGIFVLPEANTNYALALPNKIFDYVQARLAIIVGPSQDMKRVVKEYDLGAVTSGFEEADIVETLNSLTAEKVAAWKNNSDVAAEVLNAEQEEAVWVSVLQKLAGAGAAGQGSAGRSAAASGSAAQGSASQNAAMRNEDAAK